MDGVQKRKHGVQPEVELQTRSTTGLPFHEVIIALKILLQMSRTIAPSLSPEVVLATSFQILRLILLVNATRRSHRRLMAGRLPQDVYQKGHTLFIVFSPLYFHA